MADSLANVLLRVTGDADQARRELQQTSADLAAFSRQTAEAEAELDTTQARRALDELKARLDKFAAEDVTADANVRIAGAMTKIAALQAELDRLDHEDINIDVDVRRGVTERIAALTGEVERLATGIGADLAPAAEQGGISLAGLSASGSELAGAAPILIAVITALAAACVALVASAAAATAGLGALAVAAGALLLPLGGLLIGAILRFKDQADEAGTAAHALAKAFDPIKEAASKAFGPGLDAVLRGAARGLQGFAPLIKSLGPAFTQFGKAAGDSLAALGHEFSSPAWRDFFQQLLGAAKQVVPALTQAFAGFSEVMRNIASAALPFVVSGLQSIGHFLKQLGADTSTSRFAAGVRGVIGQLATWLELIKQVSRVVGGVFKAAAGPGQEFVKFLTEGAQKMADWINSAEGQKAIKQFFSDTLPLAQQLVGVVARLILIFLQFGQAISPILAPFVAGLNLILGFISRLLAAFNTLSPVMRAAFLIAAPLIAPFIGALLLAKLAVDRLGGAFSAVAGAARAAFNGIAEAAKAVWGAVKGTFSQAISFVIHLPGGLAGAASAIWGAVRGVVVRAISFVFHLPGGLAGAAGAIWGAVSGVIRRAIQFVINLPSPGSLASLASRIWDAINDALPDISINIHIPTPHVPHVNVPGLSLHPIGEVGDALAKKWRKSIREGLDDMNTRLAVTVGGSVAALTPAAIAPNLTVSAPEISAPAPAKSGGNTYVFDVTAPPGEAPDVETFLAQTESKVRARG